MSTDYDEIKAVNWSSLKHLATSALLYRWRIDHPEPRKPAFVLGGAIHTLALEPDKFAERYALFDGTRRGKIWEAWQEDHPGRESLKPPEMARVEGAAAALISHRISVELFTGGRREEAHTWTDESTGMECKGRLDYIRPNEVIDLKSSERGVGQRMADLASANYLYHGQLAFYQDGAIASGAIPRDAPPPWIVFVQSKGPYDVGCYRFSYEDIATGRALYRHLLGKLQECIAADYWPGEAPDEMQLNLPAWSAGMDLQFADETAEEF